jgi:uncharacterized protein YecE (DUF72 family)
VGTIKVGCCGFPVKQEEYFKNFDLLEIQSTFYKLPRVKTVEEWRNRAPRNFEFSLKAWQIITHEPSSPTYRKAGLKIEESKKNNYGFFKPTEEVVLAWEATKRIALLLKAKVIVFQCPPSFIPTSENIKNLKGFFNTVQRDNLIFAWEPRGEWSSSLILELCDELKLLHCVDPFEKISLYGDIKYFRLHGGARYKHKYSTEELVFLKEKCQNLNTVYCLFNNISMYEDARRFRELIGK